MFFFQWLCYRCYWNFIFYLLLPFILSFLPLSFSLSLSLFLSAASLSQWFIISCPKEELKLKRSLSQCWNFSYHWNWLLDISTVFVSYLIRHFLDLVFIPIPSTAQDSRGPRCTAQERMIPGLCRMGRASLPFLRSQSEWVSGNGTLWAWTAKKNKQKNSNNRYFSWGYAVTTLIDSMFVWSCFCSYLLFYLLQRSFVKCTGFSPFNWQSQLPSSACSSFGNLN